MQTRTLNEVWNQGHLPVIWRGGPIRPLLVRLPYAADNRDWLRDDKRSKPKWLSDHKAWSVPQSWFDELVRRAIRRYGGAYVIQPFRASEKCAPACWNAIGVHCECSCLGARHGIGNPQGKWHVVNETFAIRWGAKEFACRLLRGSR
jgi:hypothetical protein